jgi:DNA-binding MarR family transcriptional regulator
MPDTSDPFDLTAFLPYLLNQAAEATSRSFQQVYRARHGLTRTQWRVMAHLGRFGAMTARDICRLSHVEKTKVSRAVAALQVRGWLRRDPAPHDGRAEMLSLTETGQAVFADLGLAAQDHDTQLRQTLGATQVATLETALRALITQGYPHDQGD